MGNLMHAPSEEWNLRTERLISHKYLISRRPKTYLLTNQHLLRISSHPQANEFTPWTPDFSLFTLHAHKYSPPQILSGLACSLLQHAFPELHFLCYP